MASRLLRAKKKVASKLSESRAGRKVIVKFTGPSGDHIISALLSAFEKHSGRQNAKKMRLHIFKLATKCGVLYQDGQLTEESGMEAREPMASLVQQLQDQLSAPADRRSSAGLAAAVQELHNALLPVLTPHMKAANAAKFTEFCEYLGSTAFLEAFLMQEQYSHERDEILANMQKLASVEDSEGFEATRQFLRERMEARRRLLAQLIENPRLEDYLVHEDTAKGLKDWLVQQGGVEASNCILFLNSVADFRSTSSRSLLQGRARTVLDKFLGPSASNPVPVPPEVVEPMSDELLEGSARKDLFGPAAAMITAHLERMFDGGFRESQQFADLRNELTMVDFKLATQFGIGDASDILAAGSDDEAGDDDDDDDDEDEAGADDAGDGEEEEAGEEADGDAAGGPAGQASGRLPSAPVERVAAKEAKKAAKKVAKEERAAKRQVKIKKSDKRRAMKRTSGKKKR